MEYRFIYVDPDGIHWAVTTYGLVRLENQRRTWRQQFTQWAKRTLAFIGLAQPAAEEERR